MSKRKRWFKEKAKLTSRRQIYECLFHGLTPLGEGDAFCEQCDKVLEIRPVDDTDIGQFVIASLM